jgi:O-antigen ligase
MSLTANHHWLLYYQRFLAIGAIFFFFTRIDGFLIANQIFTLPTGWLLPYFAFAIPIFVLSKKRYPSYPVLLWAGGYGMAALLSHLFFPRSEASARAVIDQTFASTFFIVTTFLLTDPRVVKWVRYAIVLATSLGVFNNFFQFFISPNAFDGLYEGRARGTYLDPNDCANALILGMILTVNFLPKKYQIPWILFVGVGIALTVSRGGILCWLIVIITLHLTRVISTKESTPWMLGIGLLIFLFTFLGGGGVSPDQLLSSGGFDRISGMFSGDLEEDGSALERKGIARKGWEMFLERPLFGYGIGSTFDHNITGYTVSTHNTYLMFLAEHGFLGILILPLAIYAVTYGASGETRKIAITFALFISLISCFSHTVLGLNLFLTGFSAMAAMSATSQSHLKASSSGESKLKKRSL